MSVRFDWGGADTAPGTNTDVDALGPPGLLFKLADDASIDQNNKMEIPGGGLGPYYSCWKHIYLYCDNPDGHTINNVKIYSDGANSLGTGVDVKVSTSFPTKNSGSDAGYEVAHAAAGGTSDEMVAGHAGVTGSASIFNYTVGAGGLTVTISEGGAVINLATETSNYVCLQWAVSNTAEAGTTATETWYFSYDEA